MIIHGDNLEGLKALLPQYAGKIKLIYIDPPYNTGNEGWVYNDNVNSPLVKSWLKKTIGRDDLERHDKWLCMMWPRLSLLKELLKDEGAIFISIDENELHNLRAMMNEIFGESNFIGTFIWRKKTGGGQTDNFFVTEHEYILCYSKSHAYKWIDDIESISESSYVHEDKHGKYKLIKLAKWGNAAKKSDRPSMYFPITGPNNKKYYPIAPDGSEGRWRIGQARMKELIKNNCIQFERRNESFIPYEKVYFNEGQTKLIKQRSIIFDEFHTDDATNCLTQIFGKKDIFENPKPFQLILKFIHHSTDKNDIILDSFAGSATTAHAVLAANAEDGRNRKFILIECEDYADTITAERIRRVVKGIPTAKDLQLKRGLNGSFTYCELGKPYDDFELGSIGAVKSLLCAPKKNIHLLSRHLRS